MKKLLLFLILTTFSLPVTGQDYAIINDKDGYVNVREQPGLKSKIIYKLYSNSIFLMATENDEEWPSIIIQRSENKNDLVKGYIHKSRVLLLSNLSAISVKNFSKNACVISNDSVSITIESANFLSKNHKLKFQTLPDQNYKELQQIDNRQFWGTDGGIPRSVISSVKIFKKNKAISIPRTAFIDLYEPMIKSARAYLGRDNTIFIEMDNSDGAGAYGVIWVIHHDVFMKRYVYDAD